MIGLFKNTTVDAPSTAARIYNSVVEGINENERLPKYIVVIPDWDIIKYGDEFGKDAPAVLYVLLRFLVKGINKLVDACFESIYRKKPGAIRAGEPRILWVKNSR